MAMVATISLLLLISLLHYHFNSPIESWRAGSQATLVEAGIPSLKVPYAHRNDVIAKVNTPSDRRIKVGLQVINIYDLSLRNRTFMAEGWFWLKWPETVNAIIRDRGLDQEKLISFDNHVETDSLVVESEQPNPVLISSGEFWQDYHFSGRFYIEDLALLSFPFDDLQLSVALQLRPDALSCNPVDPGQCISLVFDRGAERHALGRYIEINGYDVIGSESKEFMHQYLPVSGFDNPAAHGAVEVSILYRANFSAAFWAYIFPLLILIGIAIVAPSLPGALGDVRLAIPTTLLLTLIFLQMGYKAELPPLDYVCYLDWLYIYAYTISAGLFLLFCWGTNAHATACAQDREESVVRRIDRVDSVVQSIAFGGLLLVLLSGLLFQP